MTELELRKIVVETAAKYVGTVQGDENHKFLVDTYNSHRPLARNYKLKYTDPWCAGFVSAVSIMTDMTDIIPTEVGAQEQLQKFSKINEYIELDSYIPKQGDVIFYNWDDDGQGDNKGYANHVGIVSEVYGSSFDVIEGNMAVKGISSVGVRRVQVNSRYIRGFGLPSYSSKATHVDPAKTPIYKYVDCDYLNLRVSPSMDADILTEMKFGSKLTYYGLINGWAEVEFDGKAGYCGASYLTGTKPPTRYRVTTALRMRKGPSVLYPTKLVVKGGSIVQYTGNSESFLGTTWREVEYGDYLGWMSSKYLDPLPSE